MLRISSKKECIVARKVKFLNNIMTRGFGLMLKAPKTLNDTAYIFIFKKDVKYTVTMWFMRFPLDLVFLSKDKKIVDLKKGIATWKNYKPKIKYHYLIELKKGTISKFRLQKGKKLFW